MKIDTTHLVIIIFLVVFVCLLIRKNKKEGLSGYGVTSALAFNNRLAYCMPGNDQAGGSFSGGCFLPHRVIV